MSQILKSGSPFPSTELATCISWLIARPSKLVLIQLRVQTHHPQRLHRRIADAGEKSGPNSSAEGACPTPSYGLGT